MSSLESIAVHRILSNISENPRPNNDLNIASLGRPHLLLLIQYASHFLQIAQLESYYNEITKKELTEEIPTLPKYYYQLLPPSVRETIDSKENIKSFSFIFHLQYAIQNEYTPEIFKYTLSEYINQLCTFGSKYITKLQLRCNLSIFFSS